MYKKIMLAAGVFILSTNLYAKNYIQNGDFESPIYKYKESPDSWAIQDSDSGNYSGLITRKFDSQNQNNYVEVRSQNQSSHSCVGTNCHRAELLYKSDRFLNYPDYLNIEGQRTKLYFKFRIDQIWDKNVGACIGEACRATVLQYLPDSTPYAVAPMMSFVLSRYNKAGGQPSLSLQHKVHCDKMENKSLDICQGKTGKVHWGSDTIIPLEVGKWYELYSHVYWSETSGSFSAGVRAVGGKWQYFTQNDGTVFQSFPTRADNVRHVFKAGIYGYGPDVTKTEKELILSFDDFTMQ